MSRRDGDDLLTRVAVLEAIVADLKEAISKQAIEYERRMMELNHSHEHAATERTKFITSDQFYAFKDEYSKGHTMLEKIISSLATREQLDMFRLAVNGKQADLDLWRSKLTGMAIGLALGGGMLGGGIVQFLIKELGN